MRRLIVVVMSAVLAFGALTGPGTAGKKKIRKMTATYDSPAIGSGDATGTCLGSNGCVEFPIGAKETSISMKIEDANGLPVYATVGQDTDPGNNFVEAVGRFCGATEKPFKIEPGVTVIVWLWALPGASPPCPGFASTGSVTATITGK